MSLTFYTAADAARILIIDRARVDGACSTGALVARTIPRHPPGGPGGFSRPT